MLLSLLLFAVAALALLVGLIMLIGSYKGTRRSGWSFALACFGAAGWTASIAAFLQVTEVSPAMFTMVRGIYLWPLVMAFGLLLYGFFQLKNRGAVMTIGGIFASLCLIALAAVFVIKPELLYSAIDISGSGNSVVLAADWYYLAYVGLFAVVTLLVMGVFVRKIRSMRQSRQRRGYVMMLWGLMVWLVPYVVFSLVLPFWNYSFVWVGAISVTVAMVFCYFATLRYRIFELRQVSAQVFSYVLVLMIAAMAYMLIFYLIFTALFRVPNPSAEIFVLNFIMIVIVLLLLPIVNEFLGSARSIIARNSIDLAYIVKKLNKLATTRVDLRNLAGFLADHLHFGYVGFLIDGKIYGSSAAKVSVTDLTRILATAEELDGVWQKVDESLSESLGGQGIGMIATLYDMNGERFGRMLLGGLPGKDKLDRRDVVQIETIINLIAVIVGAEVRGGEDKEARQEVGTGKLRRRAKADAK